MPVPKWMQQPVCDSPCLPFDVLCPCQPLVTACPAYTYCIGWLVLRPTLRPTLADFLVPLAAKMAEEPFKLLIMDSITANLRVDFSGRGELAERQQRLGQLMQRLRKVSSAAPLGR